MRAEFNSATPPGATSSAKRFGPIAPAPAANRLPGGHAHARRRRSRESRCGAGGAGQLPAASRSPVPHHAQRVAPIVAERHAAAIDLLLRLAEGVRDPTREPRAGRAIRTGEEEVQPVGLSAAVVGGHARNQRSGGKPRLQDRWKIVPCESRQPLILRLEAADDEIAEALVVHLDAPQQAGSEVAIEADEHVGRSFGTQVEAPGRRQVGEVVGLQQLLVSRALRVESRRRRQSRRRVQRNHRVQPRRQRGAPVQAAPVPPQSGNQRDRRRQLHAILDPGAASRRAPRMIDAAPETRLPATRRRRGTARRDRDRRTVVNATCVRSRCHSVPASNRWRPIAGNRISSRSDRSSIDSWRVN